MVVVPIGEQAAELRYRRFTVAEYYRMADAGVFGHEERVELIEGQIVEMYPRGAAHIWSVVDLNKVLCQRDDIIPSVFNPLRLDDCSEPVPDIAVLCADA